ncbi:MAG: hypothetical protein M1457_05770 [bacterium]|nr:hypothetical protein [bacterium]
MESHATAPLADQLALVKELYGELFILLDQSLAEEPTCGVPSRLDADIEILMGRIDGEMRRFRREMEETGGSAPSGGLDTAIDEFKVQLSDGLRIMGDRLCRRMDELARQRDGLRERLRMNLRKQTGVRGYGPRAGGSMLLESRV